MNGDDKNKKDESGMALFGILAGGAALIWITGLYTRPRHEKRMRAIDKRTRDIFT